jgi:hypothetical protein
MKTIRGQYTTRRDGGITYAYEASWHATHGDWIAWTFEARLGERFVGRSSGQIKPPPGQDVEGFVRSLVCEAIEHRRMMRAQEP